MSGLAAPSPIPEYDRKHAKKRIRAFTSDDRASHRIIEKQRREALNQNFLVGVSPIRISLNSSSLSYGHKLRTKFNK